MTILSDVFSSFNLCGRYILNSHVLSSALFGLSPPFHRFILSFFSIRRFRICRLLWSVSDAFFQKIDLGRELGTKICLNPKNTVSSSTRYCNAFPIYIAIAEEFPSHLNAVLSPIPPNCIQHGRRNQSSRRSRAKTEKSKSG